MVGLLRFYNRAAELAAVRRAVASGRPEMVVVYGRRGAGKSRLLAAALRRGHAERRPVDRPWRALFSRSGFHPDLQQLAGDPHERVLLVAPDDLFGLAPESTDC